MEGITEQQIAAARYVERKARLIATAGPQAVAEFEESAVARFLLRTAASDCAPAVEVVACPVGEKQ